jgi:formamidopyrimidine-DNA glycosylase
MPELPEVETTCRGLAPTVTGARILRVTVRERRMRWPLVSGFEALLAGRRIKRIHRRAKYVLLEMADRTLMIHLGMSGSLRIVAGETPPRLHDHVDLVLDSGDCVRFNDPRRFGSLHVVQGNIEAHPLLAPLGPEPLSADFDGATLQRATRGRRVAIKPLLMNAKIVVGVGNIYASEALFHARVHPWKLAGRLSVEETDRIASAIKAVLEAAIRVGGTTLRDYVNAEGNPGYFRQKLYVYERTDQACLVCDAPISHRVQGQRSTYWCPQCQPGRTPRTARRSRRGAAQ